MPVTNHERVGKGMELLQRGLQPFLEQELGTAYGAKWRERANQRLSDTKLKFGPKDLDTAAMLVMMDREWKDLFSDRLGKSHRAIVNELIDIRNRWAHQETFSNDDTDRALDSVTRLLRAVGAVKEADTADEIKHELRRATFDRKVYNERRRLVQPRALPAHPRCAAPDGLGDSCSVGVRRPGLAHPARPYPRGSAENRR
ncbi:MAG: hypothetical protein LDL31_13540 [Prosthecobacter sp.]|nr:hypothetical protein [Prosthecobacter sp.]